MNVPNHVCQMEAILDKALTILDELEEKIAEYKAFQSELRKLEEYYVSPQWKKDFDIEEKGLFPKDVKRGVLSEDSIYDLLERNKEMQYILKNCEDK